MDNLLATRSQMGMSLGFHIIFAVIGVSLPLMMTIAEWRWRSTGDPAYLFVAKRWAKGTTILFAVGAISGTLLSFELGLLWPRFMQYAGPVVGTPFSLDGFAFFTEAIFLGIYLYGWNEKSVSSSLLLNYGDFGIGMFDNLDGEMVVLDSAIYQVRWRVTLKLAKASNWKVTRASIVSGPYFRPLRVKPSRPAHESEQMG